MGYVIQKGEFYYFNRRVPSKIAHIDPRKVIRHALRTDSRLAAHRLAAQFNERLEAYWNDLVINGKLYAQDHYKGLIDRARLFGFSYYPCQTLADGDIGEIFKRLNKLEEGNYNHPQSEAFLGGKEIPVITVSEAIERFWRYSKPQTLNKTPDQIRKWRNPRIRAIGNFIKCNGDLPIQKITRDHTLAFRDWWIARKEKEKIVNATINKDIIHIKTIITTVSDNLNLEIEVNKLFKKLVLEDTDSETRLPFENDYIVSTLLNAEKLQGLNFEAKMALNIIAETGASVSELVGLEPEDILLNHEVPHIIIVDRKMKRLKTRYRNRKIPLVGFALDAMIQIPKGFSRYKSKPDGLSNTINKYLSENNLLPTEKHSVYSLRHSFQDRLLAVNTPDRIQTDLMGHKFDRPLYGQGASLNQKQEWMKTIELKPK